MAITDKPLYEAISNGDGTYNGFLMVRWLMEATTGKPFSDSEARKLFAEAKAKADENRARKET